MATEHQDLRFQKGQETATLRTHSEDDGSFRLDLPTGSVHARAVEGEAGMSLRVDGVSHRVRVIRHGAERTVIFAGQNHTLYQVDPLAPPRAETAGEDKLIAPIPARVSRVLVEPGAAVKKRTPLLVLEAMKMELTLSAPINGTVESVRHAVGEMVGGRYRAYHLRARRGARSRTNPVGVRIVEIGPRDGLQNRRGGCRQVRRSELLTFFKALSPCMVGMEACASAHYWALELSALDRTVRSCQRRA